MYLIASLFIINFIRTFESFHNVANLITSFLFSFRSYRNRLGDFQCKSVDCCLFVLQERRQPQREHCKYTTRKEPGYINSWHEKFLLISIPKPFSDFSGQYSRKCAILNTPQTRLIAAVLK